MPEEIRIERIDAERYRVTLPTAAVGVDIHVSLSPDAGTLPFASYRADQQMVEISNLPPAPRHYFQIGTSQTLLSNRHIMLQGTPNFRDFGGYPAGDSKYVRWGKLYRSGSLSKLSTNDLASLAALQIAAVCDFRHDDERTHEPSLWPDVLDSLHVHLPLAEGDHAIALKSLLAGPSPVTRGDLVALMAEINRDFVLKHSRVYSRVLQLVLETDGPILIHCAAGKDRTGFGSAVILGALGVSRDIIMKDYLLTAEYLPVHREIDRLLKRYNLNIPREVGAAVFGVEFEYLDAALKTIDSEYGDFDTYLREGLGFDEHAQRELRQKLLV